MDLKGKVALVTGSAQRVGKTIAIALAQRGADILIHYNRSEDAARQTVEDIRQFGVKVDMVQGNLGSPLDVERVFVTLESIFGRIDVLVNSASSFKAGDFLELTVEDWNYALAINLRAPFLCGQRAAHLMLARRSGGVIVNIADVAGQVPWVRYPQHSVSKAGLLMLTQVMAKSLGPDIRVNAVVPGPVLKPEMTNLGVWEELGALLPLKRTGRPEYVAHAVLALIENDYITGAALSVDGGDTLMGTLDML